MDNDEIFKLVNSLLSKNNASHISPEQFEEYLDVASLGYFQDLLGSKNRQVTVYGRSRLLDARLKTFRKRVYLNFGSGVAQLPPDCYHIRSLTTSFDKPVKPLDEDREAVVNDDPLASPTSEEMYYVEESTYLRLLGGVLTMSGILSYLARPRKPKYAYTRSADGRRVIYDKINSVQLDWPDTAKQAITMRVLGLAGLSMDKVLAIQASSNAEAKE